MGARLLRRRLLRPALQLPEIEARLDSVQTLLASSIERGELRKILGSILDLERLLSKVTLGTASPRELRALGVSLSAIPSLRQVCAPFSGLLADIAARLDGVDEVRDAILNAIAAEPPVSSPPAESSARASTPPLTNCAISPATANSTSPASNCVNAPAPASPPSKCASTTSSATTSRSRRRTSLSPRPTMSANRPSSTPSASPRPNSSNSKSRSSKPRSASSPSSANSSPACARLPPLKRLAFVSPRPPSPNSMSPPPSPRLPRKTAIAARSFPRRHYACRRRPSSRH